MGQAQTKHEMQKEVNTVFSNVCEPKCTVSQRAIYKNVDVQARGRCNVNFGNISSCKTRATCNMDQAYSDLAVKLDQHPSVKSALSYNNMNTSSKDIVKNVFEQHCSPEATAMQELDAEDISIKCYDDSVINMLNENIMEATCVTNVLDDLLTEADLLRAVEQSKQESKADESSDDDDDLTGFEKFKHELRTNQSTQLVTFSISIVVILVLIKIIKG